MKKDIIKILKSALESKLGVQLPEIEIQIPKAEAFGDLSTPVAMGLAKQLRKAPRKVAEDIIEAIEDRSIFEKIEIAGPGFLNFTFTAEYLHSQLKRLLAGDRSLLREDVGLGRKALVEFVSANPTGPLHIGHARGAAVGNALCNLLEETGFKVEREYYINDAGRQVKLLGMSVYARYQQLFGYDVAFPEDGYRGQYIDDEAAVLKGEIEDKFRGVSFEMCEKEITLWAYERMLSLIRK
ncbi:MAG TPA: arginine--tRNA ligase, partial [Candidatus Sulfobium mesophilum]|nr:arginine--tRNA ligase [Candidatus Sulfobium mesophilum]